MLLEELSNHPVEVFRRTERTIRDQHRRIAKHQRAVADLQAQHAASRRWWQIVKRLKQYQEVQEFRARAPVRDLQAERRFAQQEAGVNAEEEMTLALHALSDDWRLFRGYANRRGEVDHLLVGPGGIWAIEVKRRGVRVHVNGDHWYYEKFDRYGNRVEQGPLADRRGRSWGRQVTEVARDLEKFLNSRGTPVTVQTAVVVVHHRAQLGSYHNLSVSYLNIGTGPLLDHLRTQLTVLDPITRAKVAQLIRRDHAYHAERRTPHRRPRPTSS